MNETVPAHGRRGPPASRHASRDPSAASSVRTKPTARARTSLPSFRLLTWLTYKNSSKEMCGPSSTPLQPNVVARHTNSRFARPSQRVIVPGARNGPPPPSSLLPLGPSPPNRPPARRNVCPPIIRSPALKTSLPTSSRAAPEGGTASPLSHSHTLSVCRESLSLF